MELVDALADHGYALRCAAPGARAERLCGAMPFDAVLLTVEGVDECRAAAAVRVIRRVQAAALVVLVDRPLPLLEVQLLEAGADAVTARHGSMLVLMARLRRLLDRQSAARPPASRRRGRAIPVSAAAGAQESWGRPGVFCGGG